MNNNINYKYIEIKRFDDETVIKRLDVSDKSERMIDKVESGLNINLNHDDYYTSCIESSIKLKNI